MLLALAAVVDVDAIRVTPITFTPPRYLATDVPLRITIKGYNFNNNTRIRLSNNFSKCDIGTLFTPNQRPDSTIGPIVQWTPHDPSTFFVAISAPPMCHSLRSSFATAATAANGIK